MSTPCEKCGGSDGYHTFDELYEHRHWLFLSLMKMWPERAWASKLHADGTDTASTRAAAARP